MRIGNTNKGYGIVHVAIHWLTAILIFWAAVLGLTMTDLPPFEPSTFETYNFHKSLGIAVLAIAAFRIVWRLAHGAPPMPANMSDFERSLAIAAHHALYLLMFLVPILGWLNTSAAAIPVNWFGIGVLPPLMEADPGLQEIFEAIHEITAKLLMFLIILHIVGALKHHFVAKDDVLKRMIVPAKD